VELANNSIARRLATRPGVPMGAREERTEALHQWDSSRDAPARRLRAATAAAGLLLGLLLLAAPAGAEEKDEAPRSSGEDGEMPRPRPTRSWDAAIGFVAAYGSEYPGSDQRGADIAPGFGLRWGRFSFTSRSAFAVRTSDPAATGGLRVELGRSEHFRVGLGLRYDRGRKESANDDFEGLGDVPAGVMLRINPRYRLGDGWTAGGSVSFPLFGNGPGTHGEFTLGRDLRLSPATTFGAGVSLAFGSRRYLQNYFGITEEQSARSGYPVHRVTFGPSALAASAGWRTDVFGNWVLLYGVGASRLLGEPADSPLTRRPWSWNVNGGIVYHF
jgi:outer membrane scaffolding protein for murein synthesis (MipA/OmpV family)